MGGRHRIRPSQESAVVRRIHTVEFLRAPSVPKLSRIINVAEKPMPIAEQLLSFALSLGAARRCALQRLHPVREAQHHCGADNLVCEVHMSQRADFDGRSFPAFRLGRLPTGIGRFPYLRFRCRNHPQRFGGPFPSRETLPDFPDEFWEAQCLPIEFQGIRIPIVRPDEGRCFLPRLIEHTLAL